MKGIRLPIAAAVTLALFAIVAAMQWRWIAQLSDAELDRDRIRLRVGARNIQTDLNRELSRAYNLFQWESGGSRESWGQRTAEAYAIWQSTASYPELIQRVLLVQPADAGGLRMSAYNTGTQRFDPIDWPADLASLRPQLALPFRRYEAFGVRTFTGVAVAEQPLVVHPLSVSPLSGLPASFDNADAWLLLALDQQLLLNTILPEAIRENLDQADSFEYQIARDGFPRQVIYRSNPDARMDTPDESVSLLELRREYLRSETGANRRSARFPIGDTSAEAVVQARLHRWHNVKAVLPGVPAAPLNEGGVWRLDIRHRAGSLEAAVARMRRGNLLLSFAMLALVAVAIAILALAARRAHRLSEAKLAFAAAVSHELRTPLAAICSAADNLSAGIATEPAKARQYGAAILEQGRYLSGLVEQILGFAGAHFGSRQFEMEMLDPADVIAEAIDAAVPSARTAGVEIEKLIPAVLPPVVGDAAALRQALVNLLTNAIKYAAAGGWIGVSAGSGADELEISVRDRGPGIPPGEQSRIFAPFYRSSGAREKKGAGLGLTIVKQIASAHGGRVSVASAPGQGSCFTLHLPTM